MILTSTIRPPVGRVRGMRGDSAGSRTRIRALRTSACLAGTVRRLEAVSQDWGGEGHRERLHRSLRQHEHSWGVLAREIDRDHERLRPEVRDDLLRLARFVESWSSLLLARPDRARLRAMIEIDHGVSYVLHAEGWVPAPGSPPEKEVA